MRPNKELSPSQKKIYEYLKERAQQGKTPPTVREIAAAVGFPGPSSVQYQLVNLEKKGFLRRSPLHSRSMEVVGLPPIARQAPIVGRVRAGLPNTAQEEIVGHFPIPDFFKGKDCFVLEVKGDSMIGAGIQAGDYVVVERRSEAASGELVVALIGEEATLKRLRKSGGKVVLEAANPKYTDIEPEQLQILGKVVGLFRTL